MDFCEELEVDPLLRDVEDPIVFFQVFGQRYRDGELSKSGKRVRSRTVEDELRAIGTTMASLGAEDPRLTVQGKHVPRLARLFKGWQRDDAPTKRVKPVPLAIVNRVYERARKDHDYAVADLCYIGFFFISRPGETTYSTSEDSQTVPIRLKDISFWSDRRMYNAATIPMAALESVGATTLVLENQKNGVQGQGTTHGRSGHLTACPVQAVKRRVRYLRQHNMPPDTPIFTVVSKSTGRHYWISSRHVTDDLRRAAADLHSTLGIPPKDISARSLRPGGATAMLCAGIDRDITRLVGRWKSDEMLKYLHAQATPQMQHYARQMLTAGHFTYRPTDDVTQPSTFNVAA